MRHLLYFAFFAASTFFGGVAAQVRAFDYSDPAIVGGTLHECYGECVANDIRTCYYEFTLTEYLTMSEPCGDCPYTQEDCYNIGCNTAGGDVRLVTVANRMLPGPSIQVCKGDIIQVKLINKLGSEGTTIHWHGMGQIDTPYMDGVPFLTQCPILPGSSFVYNFTADPAGTHMWHSHAGFQETDGFYGSLIVREPEDVNADYYDYDLPEHVMIVWHWYRVPTAGESKTILLRPVQTFGYSLTINGYGKNVAYRRDGIDYYTPRANFTVIQGNRYRFRTIANAGVYCPIQVSVDGHTLLVIATDGASVEPIEVDSLVINAGERYDFVLTANQPKANYWIRVRGLGSCINTVSTTAILYYKGAGDADPPGTTEYDDANRSGVLLNPVQETEMDYSENILYRVSDLINTVSDAQDVSGTPDYTFYMPIAMNTKSDYESTGPYAQINNMTFTLPSIPLLTQYNEITSDMYCTQYDKNAETCRGTFCTCPTIYTLQKDALVEFIIFDTTEEWTDDHPMHFHGRKFRVVAMWPEDGNIFTLAELRAMNEAGWIYKNLHTAPLKDTVGVPARGFVVLRVRVDYPGYWLVHCHVASHFEEGMGIALKIGEDSEMVHAPGGFPTCGGDYDIRYDS